MQCHFIPKVKLRSHHYPPWMKSDLHHEVNCLRSKKRKIKSTGNKQGLEYIQRVNQSFHQNYVTKKSEYESKLTNNFAFSSNSKIYKYIRSCYKSSGIPPLVTRILPQLHLIRTKQSYLLSIFILFALPVPSASLSLSTCRDGHSYYIT